ncbi:MAG: hypothetical protein HGA66_12575, partial [Holophaga sp.]|nr:hypothetical protein [Holophaga sp.]
MQWNQNYSALNGSLLLTALVVAIPIFFLFWALAVKRMKGHVAGPVTLLITIVISVLVYRMPVSAALSASALGMVTGLFPIGWIILTAVFLFNLTVESGQFEVIKDSIAHLTDDERLHVLLIAFAFGAFVEGAAGFGAPVAIAGAMLAGVGTGSYAATFSNNVYIPEYAFVIFQMTFACITPALIIGAFAERIKFWPLIL